MLSVERFVNSIYSSNSYLIASDSSASVVLVDPGDSEPLLSAVGDRKVEKIVVTHAHFDHIYGINDIVAKHPNAVIYISQYGVEGLRSSKQNFSFYLHNPFTVEHPLIEVIKDDDCIELFQGVNMKVFATPGHHHDAMSYYIDGRVFTGDSLIPELKVVTNFKYSDKELVVPSIRKILGFCNASDVLCPGHGSICKVADCKVPYEL